MRRPYFITSLALLLSVMTLLQPARSAAEIPQAVAEAKLVRDFGRLLDLVELQLRAAGEDAVEIESLITPLRQAEDGLNDWAAAGFTIGPCDGSSVQFIGGIVTFGSLWLLSGLPDAQPKLTTRVFRQLSDLVDQAGQFGFLLHSGPILVPVFIPDPEGTCGEYLGMFVVWWYGLGR
jgi:hypothetical protein